MLTLTELTNAYFSDCLIAEQDDMQFIASFKRAKASYTWGQGAIGDTGWALLATFSPSAVNGKPHVIVCKLDAYNKTNERLTNGK